MKRYKRGISIIEPLISMTIFLLLSGGIYVLIDQGIAMAEKKKANMQNIYILQALKNEIIYNTEFDDIKVPPETFVFINKESMDMKKIVNEDNIINLLENEMHEDDEYIKLSFEYKEGYTVVTYDFKNDDFSKNGQWIKKQ